MPGTTVTAVSGPWGVVGELSSATGNVKLSLLYRLVVAGGTISVWTDIETYPDETLESLDPTDEPRVADSLTAQGYELP